MDLGSETRGFSQLFASHALPNSSQWLKKTLVRLWLHVDLPDRMWEVCRRIIYLRLFVVGLPVGTVHQTLYLRAWFRLGYTLQDWAKHAFFTNCWMELWPEARQPKQAIASKRYIVLYSLLSSDSFLGVTVFKFPGETYSQVCKQLYQVLHTDIYLLLSIFSSWL